MQKWFLRNKRNILFSCFSVCVVVLLLVSQSAFWLNRNVLDSNRFSELATQALTTEDSRNSIGTIIVDEVLQDRPLLRTVAGDRLALLVAGVLNSNQAEALISRAVAQAQLIITTPRKQPVILNTSTIKSVIVSLQDLLNRSPEDRRITVDDIPDTIVLIDTARIPNINDITKFIPWVGFISFFIAIALLGIWIWRGRKRALAVRLQITSVIIIVSGFLAILLGPLFKPFVLSVSESAESQTLLASIYNTFITPFRNQALAVVLFGVLLLVATTLVNYGRKHYTVHIGKSSAPSAKKRQ